MIYSLNDTDLDRFIGTWLYKESRPEINEEDWKLR